jgi:tripartite ATP-independent transporter DctP family solute receptor
MLRMLKVLVALGVVFSYLTVLHAAEKKVYSVKIGHVVNTDSSYHAGALKMKELLEASGRFTVQIFPNAQLGSDAEGYQALQNGDIQVYPTGTGAAVSFIPALVIFDAAFVFKNLDEARKVLADKEFFDVMQEEYEKNGFHNLGYSDMGFRQLTLNKKVRVPDDLKGEIIRTQENPYQIANWRAIGANPTPIAFNELYTALQQGTAAGQENPIEVIYGNKLYEQQKYIIETNHILHCAPWNCNKEFYDNLDDDARNIFEEAAVEAISVANEYSDKNIARYLSEIQKYGTEIVAISDGDRGLFADKVSEVYKTIEHDAGSKVYGAFQAAIERASK